MIVSVSRRTDIPAFYPEWFFKRLEEGHAVSVNPFNKNQRKHIPLREDDVTAFVFWTRDVTALLEHAHLLRNYTYYVQFTFTPYGVDVEPDAQDKKRRLAKLKAFSEHAGKERIVWRYDPVLLTDRYTEAWHMERFRSLLSHLAPVVGEVVISFVRTYRKNRRALKKAGVHAPDREGRRRIAHGFHDEAKRHGLTLSVCADTIEGVPSSRCIDNRRIAALTGKPLSYQKDSGQRPDCGCTNSVDIGAYDSCVRGCLYCYATHGKARAEKKRARKHPQDASLTIDHSAQIAE